VAPEEAPPGTDVNLVIQMQIVKTLQALSKKGKSRGGSSSKDSDSAQDADSDAEDDLMKTSAKAFRNQHKLKRRLRKDPERVVKDFLKMAREELGVAKGQAWTLLDWSRKQQMSKHRGLLRSMVILISILERSLSEKEAEARALAVQGIKGTLQCCLHGGSWERGAWLLTTLADPVDDKSFAGTPGEMAAVSSYLRALEQLKTKVNLDNRERGENRRPTKAEKKALRRQPAEETPK
jgi:hypothetical protein